MYNHWDVIRTCITLWQVMYRISCVLLMFVFLCVAHVCYMCCSSMLCVAHCSTYVVHCSSAVAHVCCVNYSNRTIRKHTCSVSCVSCVCYMMPTAHVLLMFTIIMLLTAHYVSLIFTVRCSCLLYIAHCSSCVAHVCDMLLTACYV